MTDETDAGSTKSGDDQAKPPIGKWIGIGIGAGIGSAALAAALLYAGSTRKKTSPGKR